MHALHFDHHVMGEWFDLDKNMRQSIQARFVDLGCSVDTGVKTMPQLVTNAQIRVGEKGWVYFAKFNWSVTQIAIINALESDGRFQEVCRLMKSVKIGCTKAIKRGSKRGVNANNDVNDDDYEDTEEKRIDWWRGAGFVWAISQLTDIHYDALLCDEMYQVENALHQDKINNHTGNGEWFHLNDGEIDLMLSEHATTITRSGRWSRTRRNPPKQYIREDEVALWGDLDLITEKEFQVMAEDGRIIIVEGGGGGEEDTAEDSD